MIAYTYLCSYVFCLIILIKKKKKNTDKDSDLTGSELV